jgi:hypothetical protein
MTNELRELSPFRGHPTPRFAPENEQKFSGAKLFGGLSNSFPRRPI